MFRARREPCERKHMRRSKLLVSVVAVGLMALTGCGSESLDSGKKQGGDVKASVDKEAAAMVPQAIKSKGTLTVGTDASYAPSEFLAGDGKTIQGFDIDLFTAVAKKLGLKVEFQPAKFDSIITGVQGGKYDVGVSSFTVNAERMQQATMVSYFNAGTQWATAAGNPKKVDLAKPCNATVAVQKGTVQQEEDLPPKIAACKKAGTPMRDPLVYEGQDQATAAVVSGKADAVLADSPVVAYAVDQSKGKLEALGDIYDAAPYGYVLPKDQADMGEAVVAALKSLKADGGYEKALKGWGVQDGAIDDFAVNPTL
jgi:polar amino acid transport system substrate-binding protein